MLEGPANSIWQKFSTYFENNWNSLPGLLIGIIAFWILMFLLKLTLGTNLATNLYVLATFLITLAFLIIWWLLRNYHPKPVKDNIGLVIAIKLEDPQHEKYLINDFMLPLKNKVYEKQLPISVLLLPIHHTNAIETPDQAREILRKCKSHMIIWGELKQRKATGEKNRYIFNLRGLVVHKPIDNNRSKYLSQEFSAILPYQQQIEDEMQFEGFEFRSEQVFIAADYIIGRAALLSLDADIAIKMHEGLLEYQTKFQEIAIDIRKLKILLSLEYDIKAVFEYIHNGQSNTWSDSYKKALDYNPINIGALLKKAIDEFGDGKGDIDKSLHTIQIIEDEGEKHSHREGYAWLYSKTFLYLWKEDYVTVIKYCNKLKEVTYVGEDITVAEVIRFNENLLHEYEKPQLKYWLGFVYYVKDKNIPLADKYFSEFIESAKPNMGELVERANSYLSSIKKEIGYAE